ncbi:hypothetical protein PsYK624_012140 [Phanerochaete sordida]|uniref:Uncharacterized protein n=1 Tax=Phanerochaete sordida TaxID=48140 RepID=A0A9P3L7J6_9APHY|nr:hypothetical protein PsYK624_012140 [Phanerochaete sordida]
MAVCEGMVRDLVRPRERPPNLSYMRAHKSRLSIRNAVDDSPPQLKPEHGGDVECWAGYMLEMSLVLRVYCSTRIMLKYTSIYSAFTKWE